MGHRAVGHRASGSPSKWVTEQVGHWASGSLSGGSLGGGSLGGGSLGGGSLGGGQERCRQPPQTRPSRDSPSASICRAAISSRGRCYQPRNRERTGAPLRFHAPWFVPTPRGGSPAEVAVTAPVCWSAAGRCSRMRHASTGIRPSGHRRPHPQTPALAASRPAENAMIISRLADHDLGFHLRAAPRRAATIVGAITVATSARHPGPPTSRFPTPPSARRLSRRSRPCRRTFACEEPRPCPAFQKCGS